MLEEVKAEKELPITATIENNIIGAVVSSTLFYWEYICHTDCRNVTKNNILDFPCASSIYKDKYLGNIGYKLFLDYEKNCIKKDTFYKSTNRNVIYFEYYPKLSKSIIDEIDKVLAKHYGFTDEELDFIINYDIKYRMGDELIED